MYFKRGSARLEKIIKYFRAGGGLLSGCETKNRSSPRNEYPGRRCVIIFRLFAMGQLKNYLWKHLLSSRSWLTKIYCTESFNKTGFFLFDAAILQILLKLINPRNLESRLKCSLLSGRCIHKKLKKLL